MSNEIPEPSPEKFGPDFTKCVVVTRQDVTKSQLDTAIELWFTDKSDVSVHTLVSATLEILTQLGKPKGKRSHMYNKETLQLLGKRLKMAANFFKHASKDPNHCLKFAPAANEILLSDALNLYGKVFGSLTPLMQTFLAWFTVFRAAPGTNIPTEQLQSLLPEGVEIEDLATLNRSEFLEKVFPLFADHR
jgi:hypothetical protein